MLRCAAVTLLENVHFNYLRIHVACAANVCAAEKGLRYAGIHQGSCAWHGVLRYHAKLSTGFAVDSAELRELVTIFWTVVNARPSSAGMHDVYTAVIRAHDILIKNPQKMITDDEFSLTSVLSFLDGMCSTHRTDAKSRTASHWYIVYLQKSSSS